MRDKQEKNLPEKKKRAALPALACVAVMMLLAAGCSKTSTFTGTVDFSPYGTVEETEEETEEEKAEETTAAETEPQTVEEYGVTFELTAAVMYVNDTNVNVRSEPNTSCTVVGKVNTGDEMTVTGTSSEWVRVDYNDETCYISAAYLSE